MIPKKLLKIASLTLMVALCVPDPAPAITALTSRHTLSPQSRFSPITKIYNGIQTEIRLSMDGMDEATFERDTSAETEAQLVFMNMVLEDPVYHRVILAPNLSSMLREAVKNSYDSFIDKIKETGIAPWRFEGVVTVRMFFDGDDFVMNVIDNGKTADLGADGTPTQREREWIHFGKKHKGIVNTKRRLAELGGEIRWYQLKDGTETEIRIPRENVLPLLPEVPIKEDEYIVVEDHKKRRSWDEETVRSVKEGETLGKSFRNRVAFRDISTLIGQYLHLGISEGTLIEDIKDHIDKAELAISKNYDDALLAGYEIEELCYDENEKAYYLPVYRKGFRAFHYKYYIEKKPEEEPDMTIPLGDGREVYVRVEPSEGKDLVSRTTLYRLFEKDLTTFMDLLDIPIKKSIDLRPEPDVTKRVPSNKEVENFQGEVAIVELEDQEELMTENLQACSAVCGRGKRKDGRYVYILAHVIDRDKDAQMELITQIFREQSLKEVEVYVDGFAQNRGFFESRLKRLKTDLAGIEIVLDESKNAWRSRSQFPGRVILDREGFIFEQKYTNGKRKEKIFNRWKRTGRRSVDIKEALGYGPGAMNPPLETSIERDSFGYKDIVNTVKSIYERGDVGQVFRALLREIISGKAVIRSPEVYILRELEGKEKTIADSFKEKLEPHYGKPWYGEGAPEISSNVLLDYLYFLANVSVGHYQTGKDPFRGTNSEKTKLNVHYLQKRRKTGKPGEPKEEIIKRLLTDILYANKYEGTREFKDEELRFASDYREELVQLILSLRGKGRLDLFIDNVGPELAANLQLVEYLVRKKVVGRARIHMKPAPFVVSDVWGGEDNPAEPYITETLTAFKESRDGKLQQIARNLERFIFKEKNVELKRDDFLVYKPDYMEAAEELNETLEGSSCAIFVGDYLSRKLFGHRRWPHTENPDAINYMLNYINVPVGLVKMIKSDINPGVPVDTPEDGTVGMVQVKLVNKEYVYPTPGTEESHARHFADRIKAIEAEVGLYDIYKRPDIVPDATTQDEDSYCYKGILKVAAAIAKNSSVVQLEQNIISGARIKPPEEYVSRELNEEERRLAEKFKNMLKGNFYRPWRGNGAPGVSYFVLVNYLAFLANLISGHYLEGIDPYKERNDEQIQRGVEFLEKANKEGETGDGKIKDIEALLTDVLYANKFEGIHAFKDEELMLASDYRRELAELIAAVGEKGTLDLFVDNVGPELSANLQLVDYLINNRVVGKVRIHIKSAPYSISDVWGTKDDPMNPHIAPTLEALKSSGVLALKDMSGRLAGYIDEGKIEIQRNEFLVQEGDFIKAAEKLNRSLAGSGCAIFVGDNLYRRLLGNRLWPHTEDAGVINDILDYISVPVGIVRMIKSDLKLGARADVPEDGTWGMVQVKKGGLVTREKEQRHARIFSDVVKLVEAKGETHPVILALGTSWIKGYEKDRHLQYDALNPLITSLRKFCSERGIIFIDRDDIELLGAIEKAKDGKTNAKVIVLAGQDTVESRPFRFLREDANNFLVGVNNEELTVDSYMRLMEMMTLTLNLAFDREIDLNNPNIIIKKHDKFPNVYIFIPKAEPMDYEILKEIYKIQTFA